MDFTGAGRGIVDVDAFRTEEGPCQGSCTYREERDEGQKGEGAYRSGSIRVASFTLRVWVRGGHDGLGGEKDSFDGKVGNLARNGTEEVWVTMLSQLWLFGRVGRAVS